MAHRSPSQLSACSSSSNSGSLVDMSPPSGRTNAFTIDYILSNAAASIGKQQVSSDSQVHVDDDDDGHEQTSISSGARARRQAEMAASQQARQSSAASQAPASAPSQRPPQQQQQQQPHLRLPNLAADMHRQQQQPEQTKQAGGQPQQQDASFIYFMAYMLLQQQQQQQQQQCELIAQQQQLAARAHQQQSAPVAPGGGLQQHKQQQQQQQTASQSRQLAAQQPATNNAPMDNLAMLARLTANPLTRSFEAGAGFGDAGSVGKAQTSSSTSTAAGPQPPAAPHNELAQLSSSAPAGHQQLTDHYLADIFSGLKQRADCSAANGTNAHHTPAARHFSSGTAPAAQHQLPQHQQQLQQQQQQLQHNIRALAQTLAYPPQPVRQPPATKRPGPYASLIGHSKPTCAAATNSIINDAYRHSVLLNQQLNSAPALSYSASHDSLNNKNTAHGPVPMVQSLPTGASQQAALRAHHLAQLPTQHQLMHQQPDESLKRDRGRPAKTANGEQNNGQNVSSPLSPPSNSNAARANTNPSSQPRTNGSGQASNGTKVDNLKPAHSYIGLIAMCILSSREKRMVLSDIYRFILHHYPYYRNRGNGWRNSVRHNLSLNECFQKSGRAENGKGHYWTIHPANMEDFMNGDFRRRRAQRKVRRWNLLDVPSDESDDESVEPESSRPPLPEHFKRSIEMHRQLELVLHGSCAFEAFRAAAAANSVEPSSRYPSDANCVQQIGPHDTSSPEDDTQSLALIKNKSQGQSESVGDDMVDVEQDRNSSTTSPMSSTIDDEEELSVCAGCDESVDGLNSTTTATRLVSPMDAAATTAPSNMPTTTSPSSSTTSAGATDSDFIRKATGILCEHE